MKFLNSITTLTVKSFSKIQQVILNIFQMQTQNQNYLTTGTDLKI